MIVAAKPIAVEEASKPARPLRRPDISIFTPGTQKILRKHDRLKAYFSARPNKPKDATCVRAAHIELKSQQIPLAIIRGVNYDHVTSVENGMRGLRNQIGRINARLEYVYLQANEREVLQRTLAETSKLLNYVEGFVKNGKK